MENIVFTLNTVLPVFLIIAIGILLRKIKMIDENFISISSKIVFKLAMPSLVFLSVSNANLNDLVDINMILFAIGYLVIVFVICLIAGLLFIKDKSQVGVFTQAVFRGNYGIVGLALLLNMLGEVGFQKGAIVLAVASPLFNILATIGLIIPHHRISFQSMKTILIKIVTNPIVIALFLSFIVIYLKMAFPGLAIPVFINKALEYLKNMTLALALIGIGGSLSLSQIKDNMILVVLATFLRLAVFPVIFTIIAVHFGFRNESLAALFMLFAVPTAVAGFVFAKTMEGDADLAANLIVTTTTGSVFTLSIGVYLLKSLNLI